MLNAEEISVSGKSHILSMLLWQLPNPSNPFCILNPSIQAAPVVQILHLRHLRPDYVLAGLWEV